MTTFAIAGLQLKAPNGGNVELMVTEIDAMMRRFPWLDMVVCPELAANGTDKATAEPMPGPTEQRFQEVAKRHSIWLLPGSMFEAAGELVYNTSPVISPEGVAASLRAVDQLDHHRSDHHSALQRQLQQVEYEAQRAFLQYDQADPGNRLVVDTLEHRWNEKLEKVEQVQNTLDAAQIAPQILTEQDKQSILALGKHFADTWHHSECPMTLKKKIIRCLIKEIIVDIDKEKQQLSFIIHWQGGSHTSLIIPRPLPANQGHKTVAEDLELIQKMASRYSDAETAKVLSKLGRKTGKGNRWTQSSVGLIRRKLGIKPAPKNKDVGILNMAQAKHYCGVSDSTLMRLIKANLLPAGQVAPFAPYEIKQSDLDKEPVSSILKTLKKTGKP